MQSILSRAVTMHIAVKNLIKVWLAYESHRDLCLYMTENQLTAAWREIKSDVTEVESFARTAGVSSVVYSAL
jgi:hypothetical protein